MATGGANVPLAATTNTRRLHRTEQAVPTPGEMYRSRVWEDLRKLLQQDHLADVMLATEGRSIPCHKVLLAAASKFFYDKFITNPESLEHNILDIDDIDFDTLTSVVAYIYSGNIELTVEKTEKLLPASVSLMLPELTKECKTFLGEKNSDISDCIAVYKVAKANSLENAAQRAWQIMLDNFQSIIKTSAFKKLSEAELKVYIGAEGLNVANEDPVFEAVVTWVRHDMENRKAKFHTLLKHVTLSHCSVDFLTHVAMQEPLMESVDCLRRVAAALASQARSPSLQLGAHRKVGDCNNSLIAVYTIYDHYKHILQCWVMKGLESKWLNKGSVADKMVPSRSICWTGDGIFISGGGGGSWGYEKYSNECWKLSLPAQDWTAVSNLNVARTCHTSVCVGGQVYVLGGYNGGRNLTSVEYLHDKTGTWCLSTDMPLALPSHIAVSYKRCIYVFAGCRSRETLILDTVTKKWSRKADMPQFCTKGCSVVYGDRIYVLGGDDTCFISYKPGQDQWQPISRPRENLTGRSAVVWGDRILLCGGKDTTVIEEYNPHTDTWAHWKHSLPKPDCLGVFAVKQ